MIGKQGAWDIRCCIRNSPVCDAPYHYLPPVHALFLLCAGLWDGRRLLLRHFRGGAVPPPVSHILTCPLYVPPLHCRQFFGKGVPFFCATSKGMFPTPVSHIPTCPMYVLSPAGLLEGRRLLLRCIKGDVPHTHYSHPCLPPLCMLSLKVFGGGGCTPHPFLTSLPAPRTYSLPQVFGMGAAFFCAASGKLAMGCFAEPLNAFNFLIVGFASACHACHPSGAGSGWGAGSPPLTSKDPLRSLLRRKTIGGLKPVALPEGAAQHPQLFLSPASQARAAIECLWAA